MAIYFVYSKIILGSALIKISLLSFLNPDNFFKFTQADLNYKNTRNSAKLSIFSQNRYLPLVEF